MCPAPDGPPGGAAGPAGAVCGATWTGALGQGAGGRWAPMPRTETPITPPLTWTLPTTTRAGGAAFGAEAGAAFGAGVGGTGGAFGGGAGGRGGFFFVAIASYAFFLAFFFLAFLATIGATIGGRGHGRGGRCAFFFAAIF